MKGSSIEVGIGGRVSVGALCGFAWAGALRTYMAAINPAGSHVDWAGTFLGVLLPGALVGSCLAASGALDASGTARTRIRWLAASPALFAIVPMLAPGALMALFTTGLGGGAVGVALGAITGGYALGGRRFVLRVAGGVFAAAVTLGIAASVPAMGGAELALTTPRGAWMTLFAGSLSAVLCVAAALPFRQLSPAIPISRSGPHRRTSRVADSLRPHARPPSG